MLDDIEASLNVELPEVYRMLFSDGMLDWGEQGPHWYKEVYPKIRTRPPLLLFANDFRLIQPRDVANRAATVTLATKAFHAIVPVGRNGAGELFCLLFDDVASINSVCKVNKKTGDAVKLARDFPDYVFRELLAAVV